MVLRKLLTEFGLRVSDSLGRERLQKWLQFKLGEIPSLKLTYPLKIGLPKRKRSSSNHPFSGAKMLVSGRVWLIKNFYPDCIWLFECGYCTQGWIWALALAVLVWDPWVLIGVGQSCWMIHTPPPQQSWLTQASIKIHSGGRFAASFVRKQGFTRLEVKIFHISSYLT